MSELSDQVAAGAIMWVFGSFILLSAAVIDHCAGCSIPRWPNRKQIRQSRAIGGPQRAVSSFDLLRAPVVGSLLRARYGRRALQAILLILAVAVIMDGLFRPPDGSDESCRCAPVDLCAARSSSWRCWQPGISSAWLAHSLCRANWGAGWGLQHDTGRTPCVPSGSPSGLLVLFFWAYEAFDIWDSPHLTAWILVGYFVAAFAVDTFFRGASFCKYVCPIGQFNFVSSLVSPLEVKVRSQEACTACATHDCVRGNERQRGCELQLFLPRKVGNMDCTFCLDCVKACPHDNIGILALAPGRDLVKDPIRSSLGRFSRRPDIAALALVVVFSAFVSAAAMVAPVAAWRDRLTGRFLVGLNIACHRLVFSDRRRARAGASDGRRNARRTGSGPHRETKPGAFLPFLDGIASTRPGDVGSACAFSLVDRLEHRLAGCAAGCGRLGVGWLGTPRWTASSPLFAPDAMLAIQLLLLDAGVLLSLYVGWRIARGYTSRASGWSSPARSLGGVAAALYAAGIWVFLQPMQMRGMVHG